MSNRKLSDDYKDSDRFEHLVYRLGEIIISSFAILVVVAFASLTYRIALWALGL